MPGICWLLGGGGSRNQRHLKLRKAASFYAAAYAAMNVGIFAVITVISGYDEHLPLIEDYRGASFTGRRCWAAS